MNRFAKARSTNSFFQRVSFFTVIFIAGKINPMHGIPDFIRV
jgi:hypothetical protein